jgi:hypothetical protein
MHWVGRLRLLVGAVLWCGASSLGTAPAAAQGPDAPSSGQAFPRLANMYLHGAVDPADIPALARWDMLILDPVWTNDQLRQLRDLNPDIKIFFYTCPYCLTVSPEPTDGWRRLNLEYVRSNDLWWRNADRSIASDWQGVSMVNITDLAPVGPWGSYRRWLAVRMAQLVNSNSQLDGIFYDNFWKSVSWQQGKTLRLDSDCNPTHNPAGCNGQMDSPAALDTLWNRALSDFAHDTRHRFDDLERSRGVRRIAIMGNGASDYFGQLNGALYEHFPSGHTPPDAGNRYGYNWNHEMFASQSGYLSAPFRTTPFNAQVLNAVWTGSWDAPARSPDFERHKRFTFASALLGDGFYSLDAEEQGHGSLWWEPEYDGGGLGPGYLGAALGPMRRIGVIGGTEYVRNGSFSSGPVTWESLAWNVTGTWSVDRSTYYTAPSAARIDISDGLPEGSFKLYQSVPVLGGYSYTLSFWARASRPQEIVLHLYSDNCQSQRCLNDQRFRIGPNWKEYSLTFVSNGNAEAGLDLLRLAAGHGVDR